MTHDELMARLDGQIESSKVIGCKCPACDNAVALRAVVELHKPQEKLPNTCQECDYYGDWPCSTIQAIEKELNA